MSVVKESKKFSFRPSRAAQRRALIVVLATWVGLAIFGYRIVQSVRDYDQKPISKVDEWIDFEIQRGSSLPNILDQLVAVNVLPEKDASYFKLYVLHKGAAGKITAGHHRARGTMNPAELLEELMRRPAARDYKVTIPEGRHHIQIAEILSEASSLSKDEFLTAMQDTELLAEFGIDRSHAEGFLFPDTYKFRVSATAAEIVRKLLDRHHQVYEQIRRNHNEAAQSLRREFKWGKHEIMTLASIVEKETGAVQERPLIAGVFLNRLRFSSFRPKLLQTDPTIIYGCVIPEQKSEACKQFEGRIRTMHLRDKDNVYNTYTHEGLPPGPISNPGRAAIESVFAPTKSRYLYFVAKNDGTHYFSKSVGEHEKAVDKYIRGKSQ